MYWRCALQSIGQMPEKRTLISRSSSMELNRMAHVSRTLSELNIGKLWLLRKIILREARPIFDKRIKDVKGSFLYRTAKSSFTDTVPTYLAIIHEVYYRTIAILH